MMPLSLQQEDEQTRLVFPDGKDVLEKRKSADILNEWCLKHGSSLKGRMESFRYLTGTKQKAAVLISEQDLILYFPLSGIRDHDLVWLRYDAVVRFQKKDASHTDVLFTDGSHVIYPCNVRVIRLQMKRCSEFLKQVINN